MVVRILLLDVHGIQMFRQILCGICILLLVSQACTDETNLIVEPDDIAAEVTAQRITCRADVRNRPLQFGEPAQTGSSGASFSVALKLPGDSS